MPFIVGETIGAYRLVEKLGQGGMATVFKAYHPALDRYVAMKVLHPAFMEDSNFLARFQREARMVAKLDHPNIVSIYDSSDHEGCPYLVMKYIEGETLKAHLKRDRLSHDEILRVLDSVGTALQYAHERNILHRDIKPSNVLITKEGHIYLTDFGLARIAQSGETSLTADRMVGTPQYMSPEQATARSDLDNRTDIYSLGVMLYEMVVGQVPFNADTPFSIIHDHIYTPLPLPRQINPDISESMERILLKALAKNPDDRFNDIAALVAAAHSAIIGGDKLPSAERDSASMATTTVAPIPKQAKPITSTSQPISPTSGVTGGTLSATPSTPVESPDGVTSKKEPKTGLLIIGLLALVVMLIFCAVVGRNLLRRISSSRNSESTTMVELIEIEPNLAQAREAMESAVLAWENGDIDTAARELEHMYVVKDIKFYQDALWHFNQNDAWLLSAMMIFSEEVRPLLGWKTEEQLDKIHEVLYMAAGDPLAKDFINQHADKPLFPVAVIRYDLLYGDDPEQARRSLADILNDPTQLKQFPEARLLEVELVIQLNNSMLANELLDELLQDENLPEWVGQNALELKRKANP